MAEYIERGELKQRLELSIKSWGRDSNNNAQAMVRAYQDVLSRVQSIPNADVVAVVRCKDCKNWEALGGKWDDMHHRKDGRCNALIRFHDSERYCTLQDHYCSYGELKECGNNGQEV